MNVELSSDQQAAVESLVAAGRFPSVHEALREAVELLVSRERLKEQIQEGIAQADRENVLDHESVFRELRAMAAAAGQSARRP
jgi:putative addiction module CopG family antidote